MTPEQYQRIKQIFLDVRELPRQQHAASVAELAGDDLLVRERTLRMLEQDARDEPTTNHDAVRQGLEGLLDRTAPAGVSVGAAQAMPETIGQYRILRRVGSGGMGDVFEGQQETPRRSVAIKLMRAGMESEAMARRFRREIEFVGRLSHPGIAQVYEAGMTSIGGVAAPYYAMEYVSGLPLTAFVTARALPLTGKLRLFAAICDTVQYAHQQGVIHRDLKPANIMVQEKAVATAATSAERTGEQATGWGAGEPLPRILDFGIARAVAVDGTVNEGGGPRTLATEAGQIIGTVPYMSPEQIGGRAGDVDTRTDVYALGVILFEVLTGRLPFATEGLSIVEAAKLKAGGTPMRLSEADRSLRGDLETIVGKALEAEKQRRYATASELGADVRRFLNDEVIEARSATLLYQVSKFAKRNRAVVVAAGLAIVALVGGVVATTLQAREAIRQRDVAVGQTAEAERQTMEAERQKAEAERQKTEAERQAKLASRKSFVAESVAAVLLDTLEQATPNVSPGKEPLLIEAIEYAETQAYDPEFINSPEVQAVVLHTIGIIRRERGDYEKADKDLSTALAVRRSVLASDDPNLADTLTNMGLLRKKQERLPEAAALMQEAVDVQRRCTVPDDQRLGRNLYNLGSMYVLLGELDKGRSMLDESLAIHQRLLGDEHEIIGIHLTARAKLAIAQNRWDVARDFADKALAMYRKTVGPSHPSIASGLRESAAIYSHNGDKPKALAMLTEADAMAHEVFPIEPGKPAHPTLLAIRRDLVTMLRGMDRDDEAQRLESEVPELQVDGRKR